MSGCLNAVLASGGGKVAYLEPTAGNAYAVGVSLTAGIRVDSDGSMYATNFGGTYVAQYVWNTNAAPASGFDVRLTITGGSPGTFTAEAAASGVWINLASDREWTRQAPGGVGTNSVNFNIDIRDATTLLVIASSTGTLTAERDI